MHQRSMWEDSVWGWKVNASRGVERKPERQHTRRNGGMRGGWSDCRLQRVGVGLRRARSHGVCRVVSWWKSESESLFIFTLLVIIL